MKATATALVVVVAVIFGVTKALEGSVSWLSPVRATAEAAMVGALADWFAVTALFRRPLGLPIPHTAIIATNKDRIGRALGQFVQQHFLAPDLLAQRVAEARPAHQAGAWLADAANARRVTGSIATVLRGLPDVFDDEEIAAAVRRGVLGRIRATPAAPLLARGLEVAIAEGQHRALVDAVLARAADYLEANREALRRRLRQESPRWVPGAVDDRIFARIHAGVQRLLSDLASDRDHPLRRDIDGRLVELVDRLRRDPELAARVDARKDRLLSHPDVQAWAGSVWVDVKAFLLDAMGGGARSPLRSRLEATLATAGARLRDDAALQRTVDRSLIDVMVSLASQYGRGAADYIAATVEQWNPDETADRLELVIGRDLQFIRINGTVVGGLVGLVIYLAGNLL